MKRTATTVLAVCLAASIAVAGDPLKGANYREHVSGPTLEPGALEGKVVLLEYFGFR